MDEETRYIPFTSDYGFKVTFGNESNTLFLRKALQALIRSEIPIRSVSFDKTTFEGTTPENRSGIYDISCIDEMDNHFLVEMQLSGTKYFLNRLKFYGFHKLDTMVKKGEYKFDDLNKIYCVGIIGNKVSPLKPYHNIGCIRNEKGKVMDEQISFITVELEKFKKTSRGCHSDLDKLIYTMKMINEVKEPTKFPPFWTEEWLKVAIEELDTRKLSPEDRLAYVMTISRNAEAIRREKQQVDEAKAEGKAEGIAEGKAEGKAEGITLGLIQTARTMKLLGEPIARIRLITGLTEEQIVAL